MAAKTRPGRNPAVPGIDYIYLLPCLFGSNVGPNMECIVLDYYGFRFHQSCIEEF